MRALIVLLLGLVVLGAAITSSASAQAPTYEQLNAQFSAHFRANRQAEAATLMPALEAASRARFGPAHKTYADLLYSFGSLESLRGNLPFAEQQYLSALAIMEQAVGPNHRDISDILSDLAQIYIETDRLAEAEAAYRRSQSIDARTLPANDPAALGSINNFAILLGLQNRFGEAEDLLRRTLAAAEPAAARNPGLMVSLLGTLGANYMRQLRFAEAEPLLARSLALSERYNAPRATGTALVNLANARKNLGRIEDAIALLQRALAIESQTNGTDHPNLISSLNNLGTAYVDLQRYAEAETLYRRALAIAETRFGPANSRVAIPLQNLGDVMIKSGRHADAEPFLARAYDVNLATRGPTAPLTIQTQSTRGLAAAAGNNFGAALRFGREATGAIVARSRAVDAARGVNASPVLQQRYVFDDHLTRLAAAAVARTEPSDELGREAFMVAQWPAQSQAGAAIQQMAARFSEGDSPLAALVREAQDLDTRWLATEARFKTALEQTSGAKPAGGRGDNDLAKVTAELAGIEQRQGVARTRLAGEFPGYAALTRPQPLAVDATQRLLGADEALVFLYVAPAQTTVFALSRTGFAWHAVPITQAALAGQVQRLRASLDFDVSTPTPAVPTATATPLFDAHEAHALFKSLLGPADHIIAKAEHVMIVPTGSLSSMPFQVLVTAEPPPGPVPRNELPRYRDVAWLAKRQATSVLPAIASLGALRSHAAGSPAPEPLIGFGDPVFHKTAPPTAAGAPRSATDRITAESKVAAASQQITAFATKSRSTRTYSSYFRGANTDLAALRQSLAPLPETADELRAVAGRLGARTEHLKLGAAASEVTVKGLDLARYRVVYFATHGLVAGELQGFGEPSLALTIPDVATALDDGLLTSSEIAALKLRADWVVLSACNTAAGDGTGADALSGLARSFFYAGARALLVTHWAVDSRAAVSLTTSTFGELDKAPAIGRAEALRRSMLALMQDASDPHNAYPGIWAPFVVVGEGGPIGLSEPSASRR